MENSPDLWRSVFPEPQTSGHKYHRGHTAIVGSDTFTGATRLAADACSRIGSGLVTVLSAAQAQVYRATLPADIMVADGPLEQVRSVNCILAGPGGVSDAQANSLQSSDVAVPTILDADAIRLSTTLAHATKVITPHDAEFERYFGAIDTDRVLRAVDISHEHGLITVLKGPHTIIADPNGRIAEYSGGSPYLAKAGTGDVLAGLIAGLVAQGMPAFEAACAGVWLHGEASRRIGPGLIPQDLVSELRPLLRQLLA